MKINKVNMSCYYDRQKNEYYIKKRDSSRGTKDVKVPFAAILENMKKQVSTIDGGWSGKWK